MPNSKLTRFAQLCAHLPWVGLCMQRIDNLSALSDAVKDLRIIFANIFSSPTSAMALKPIQHMRSLGNLAKRYDSAMNALLRARGEPPQQVLNAIDTRLQAAGSKLTPLQFLHLIDRDWGEVIFARIEAVHERNFERAFDAFPAITDGKNGVEQEDWQNVCQEIARFIYMRSG